MTKKITALFIALIMLCSFCACGSNETATQTAAEAQPEVQAETQEEAQAPVANATRIVMWSFNDDVPEEDRPELIKAMDENMSALVGQIDGLVAVEYCGAVGDGSDRDVVLITKFESFDDIAPYTENELHLNVGATYFKPYLTERVTVNIPQ